MALLPVVLISIFIIVRDKEREPAKTLVKYYALGLLSVIITLVVSFIFDIDADKVKDPFILFFSLFFGVGLIEEGAKWISVKIGMIKDIEYNNMYDAIVFAVAVSLGFAGIENILYLFMNMDSIIFVSIGRALLSVPGHAIYGVFMGWFLEKAKISKMKNDNAGYVAYSIISLLLPAFIHTIFDFLLFVTSGIDNASFALLLFCVFIVYVIILYIIGIVMVVKASKKSHLLLDGREDVSINNVATNNISVNNYYTSQPVYNPRPINFCPSCGSKASGNYCMNCGRKLV